VLYLRFIYATQEPSIIKESVVVWPGALAALRWDYIETTNPSWTVNNLRLQRWKMQCRREPRGKGGGRKDTPVKDAVVGAKRSRGNRKANIVNVDQRITEPPDQAAQRRTHKNAREERAIRAASAFARVCRVRRVDREIKPASLFSVLFWLGRILKTTAESHRVISTVLRAPLEPRWWERTREETRYARIERDRFAARHVSSRRQVQPVKRGSPAEGRGGRGT